MSETYGTIVIPNFAGMTSESVNNIPNQPDSFVEALFKHGGFNLNALVQGCYGITDAVLKGAYVQLSSIDPDWTQFANSAMKDDRHIEFYASFSDEYGTHLFFIKNADGESFKYRFEEESDEFDQDDFDYQIYLERHQKSAEKWLGLCPAFVKDNFPDVLAYPPENQEEE
jgi:hypothetical protein